jgi:hypothetical protein
MENQQARINGPVTAEYHAKEQINKGVVELKGAPGPKRGLGNAPNIPNTANTGDNPITS